MFPLADPAITRLDTELLNEFDRKIRKEKVVSCLIIQVGYRAYEYHKNKKQSKRKNFKRSKVCRSR
ncbi:hypothetical protein EMIT07CA2_20614 [Brevibacillus sp. IT-7CA2]